MTLKNTIRKLQIGHRRFCGSAIGIVLVEAVKASAVVLIATAVSYSTTPSCFIQIFSKTLQQKEL